MDRIVHIQTAIETIFGVLDDDGNVIPQRPITAQFAQFSESRFAEAYAKIAEARDIAAANMEAQMNDGLAAP